MMTNDLKVDARSSNNNSLCFPSRRAKEIKSKLGVLLQKPENAIDLILPYPEKPEKKPEKLQKWVCSSSLGPVFVCREIRAGVGGWRWKDSRHQPEINDAWGAGPCVRVHTLTALRQHIRESLCFMYFTKQTKELVIFWSVLLWGGSLRLYFWFIHFSRPSLTSVFGLADATESQAAAPHVEILYEPSQLLPSFYPLK